MHQTVEKAAPRAAGRLLAILGLAFGVAVTIGNTIGSGILRAPGEVAARLPDGGLFMAAWALGAGYAFLGANALAELAALTRQSGGYTVFVRRALGPYLGFVAGWSDWLSTCSSLAAAAIVVGEYSGLLFPPLAGAVVWTAGAVVLAFAALQWRGVRVASATQELTSALKALAFLAFVAACFALGGGRAAGGAEASLAATGLPLVLAFVLAMQAVIFTFDGYAGVIYFAGEFRDPERDIARSIFGGALAVALIYVLTNLAFLYVVPVDAMAGETLVAGAAARELFGPGGDTVIRSLVVLSLLSAMNAFLLIGSRIFYATSGAGVLAAGARVSPGGTPTVGLIASTAAALAFVATGAFDEVIAVTAFFFVANYTLSFLSVFVLRRREPHAQRPYRARGHPWTTGLVLVGSLAFLAGSLAADPRHSLYAVALLAASWPAFRLLAGGAASKRRSGGP